MSNLHEQLAQWYLRLNGFFTIDNFVIHDPGTCHLQRTDIDAMAVRFPGRFELAGGAGLKDDDWCSQWIKKTLFVLVEVTSGRCKLNGPIRDPNKRNLQLAMGAAGILPPNSIEHAADDLYREGIFVSENYVVLLVCFGREINSALDRNDPRHFKSVIQITWSEVLRFVFRRYKGHWRVKCQHQQWPEIGHLLWEKAGLLGNTSEDENLFVRKTSALLRNDSP
jgi:hypothetical protein